MRSPRVTYPPGHPRRDRTRDGLRQLGAEAVRIAFESRNNAYRLLTYRLHPEQRRLHADATEDVRRVSLAQIRQALPANPGRPARSGRLNWDLVTDRFEIGY